MAEFGTRYVLQFDADTTKLLKSLTTVEREAKETEGSIKRLGASAKTAFSGFGAGQLVQIAAGASLITKTVGAYGALINAQQTATQVFGDSYKTISDFAKQASEDVGLSERAATELTTKVAALGKAAGLSGEQLAQFSIDVTKLGADLAAAFNTSTEQAVNAIISGLSGSSIEPLREYGIVINDTIIKLELLELTGERVTGTLTQQQRTLGITSILWKQSADYVGQFDREADGLVGTQQRLNASVEDTAAALGESLAPAAQSFLNFALEMTRGLAGLNDKTGGLLGAAAGAIALRVALNPLISPMKTLANEAIKMGGGFAAVGGGMKIAVAAFDIWIAMQAINSAYTAQTNKQMAAFNEHLDEFSRRAPDAVSNGRDFAKMLDELAKVEARKDAGSLWDRLAGNVKDAAEELVPLRDETERFSEDAAKLKGSEFIDFLRELATESPQTALALKQLAEQDSSVAQQMEELGITTDMLNQMIEAGAEARGKHRAEDERWAQDLKNIEDAAYGAAGGLDAVAEADEAEAAKYKAIAKRNLERYEQLQKLKDVLTQLEGTRLDRLAENFADIFEAPTGLDTLSNIRDINQAMIDLHDIASEIPDDMAAFTDPANEMAGAFLDAVEDLKGVVGPQLEAALTEGGITNMLKVGATLAEQIAQGMRDAGFKQADIDQMLAAIGIDPAGMQIKAKLLLEADIADEAQQILDLMKGEGIVGLEDFLKLQASIEADPEATLNSLYAILQEKAGIELPAEVVPDLEEAQATLDSAGVTFSAKANVDAAADRARIEGEVNRGGPLKVKSKLEVDDSELDEATRQRTIFININTIGDPDDASRRAARNAVGGTSVGGTRVTNYFTIPTADPSAHMRAVQRWSRLNGQSLVPVTRGR